MTVALWIIALFEVVRAIQNTIQINMLRGDKDARDNAYSEFVKSLKKSDREWVRDMLERFEEVNDGTERSD